MSSVASSTSSPPTSSASSASAALGGSVVVSSQGIGSGLDIASIVSSLTTAHAAPETNALNRSKAALTDQLNAFKTFDTALSTFQATLATLQDPTQFAGRTATLADATIATATATSSAVPGQYSLEVLNLATAASLSSPPVASAASAVGTGILKISVGGASSSITVDGSNNSLVGIAEAINSATDNPGVRASIITTTEGSRLVLSGSQTGALNAIKVSQSGGDGGLAKLAYDPAAVPTVPATALTQTQAAQDAKFTINGFAATNAGNQVSTAVSGVTFNLLKPTALATPTSLTIGDDTAGAQTSIGTFVTALNGLLTAVQGLTSFDQSTQTAGPLLGNATLQGFKTQLSKILGQVNAGVGIGPNTLSAIGLSANPQGTFSTDSSKLGNALTAGLGSVAKLFGGPGGIATQLNTFVTQYSQVGGLLDTISNSLKTSLSSNASQLTALTARMSVYSATLTAEYNAMDTAVALLKQTQTFLTQEFSNGATGAGGSTSSSTGLGNGTVSTG